MIENGTASITPPRFMTDTKLMAHFGFGERALKRLRLTGKFPGKDSLVGKTDSRAVDRFFDDRAGLIAPGITDGNEDFPDSRAALR